MIPEISVRLPERGTRISIIVHLIGLTLDTSILKGPMKYRVIFSVIWTHDTFNSNNIWIKRQLNSSPATTGRLWAESGPQDNFYNCFIIYSTYPTDTDIHGCNSVQWITSSFAISFPMKCTLFMLLLQCFLSSRITELVFGKVVYLRMKILLIAQQTSDSVFL